MRVTMPGAGLKPLGKVIVRPRRGRVATSGAGLLAFLSVCISADLAAPAPVSSPSPAPHAATHVLAPAGKSPSGAQAPDLAVVYDDIYRPPAKDLLLGLEGERKAEADARFVHGLMLEETSDADQAMDEYLKALAIDPGNVELSIKVAWEYLRRGDTPSAINLLKDTIKAAPKQARPCLALANIYYNNLNKVDLAQKYTLQALELDPGNISCYEYLRDIYKSTNQSQKFPALLERAAKVDSKDPIFWLRLGRLYAEMFAGDDTARAAEDIRKTTAIFQKALAVSGSDIEIIDAIADFLVTTDQVKDAVPLYQKIIDIDPTQNSARENLARCYQALNEPKEAAAALEELIRINPVQPHAYELLAKLYEDAGQMEKAVANYEQSLLISPNDPQGYERLARRLLDLKQPERAVTVLTEARKRFRDEPGFSFLLGLSLEEAKQHQQAVAVFEQTEVEARNTGKLALLNSQFYFAFGVATEQAGLYDKAAQLLKKSLETEDDPTRIADASNYLGYMWVDHDQNVEEGGDLIKKAVELEPENGAYLDSLGWYFYKTSHFDQALEQFMKAVEKIKPEDPVVYEHLGDTYLKLNDTAKAIGSWQKAVDLDSNNPSVPGLTKKILAAKGAPPSSQATPPPPKS